MSISGKIADESLVRSPVVRSMCEQIPRKLPVSVNFKTVTVKHLFLELCNITEEP